jgi:hypothetical protein
MCIVDSTALSFGVRMKKFVPEGVFLSQVAKRIHKNDSTNNQSSSLNTMADKRYR